MTALAADVFWCVRLVATCGLVSVIAYVAWVKWKEKEHDN